MQTYLQWGAIHLYVTLPEKDFSIAKKIKKDGFFMAEKQKMYIEKVE
jgi:hypothetical protein